MTSENNKEYPSVLRIHAATNSFSNHHDNIKVSDHDYDTEEEEKELEELKLLAQIKQRQRKKRDESSPCMLKFPSLKNKTKKEENRPKSNIWTSLAKDRAAADIAKTKTTMNSVVRPVDPISLHLKSEISKMHKSKQLQKHHEDLPPQEKIKGEQMISATDEEVPEMQALKTDNAQAAQIVFDKKYEAKLCDDEWKSHQEDLAYFAEMQQRISELKMQSKKAKKSPQISHVNIMEDIITPTITKVDCDNEAEEDDEDDLHELNKLMALANIKRKEMQSRKNKKLLKFSPNFRAMTAEEDNEDDLHELNQLMALIHIKRKEMRSCNAMDTNLEKEIQAEDLVIESEEVDSKASLEDSVLPLEIHEEESAASQYKEVKKSTNCYLSDPSLRTELEPKLLGSGKLSEKIERRKQKGKLFQKCHSKCPKLVENKVHDKSKVQSWRYKSLSFMKPMKKWHLKPHVKFKDHMHHRRF